MVLSFTEKFKKVLLEGYFRCESCYFKKEGLCEGRENSICDRYISHDLKYGNPNIIKELNKRYLCKDCGFLFDRAVSRVKFPESVVYKVCPKCGSENIIKRRIKK